MNAIQITFRGMTVSPALSAHIEDLYERLASTWGPILSAHCTVQQANHHSRKGRHFQVHLVAHVRGRDFVVTKDPVERESREDPYEAVDEAFAALERMMNDHFERLHDRRAEAR